jgi:cytochrome c553
MFNGNWYILSMKKATIFLLSILFVIVFGLVCRWFTATDSQSIKLAENIAEPKIAFDQEAFDFGKVLEDVEIKHVFKIFNRGKDILDVTGTYTSCGCTVAKLSKRFLKSGESMDLLVTVDTAMKQGKVSKEIFVNSNDPHRAVASLKVSMDVADAHIGMTEAKMAKIFTSEKCAYCHVMPGVGLMGGDLFEADCAMCHGKAAKGAVGPALVGPYKNPAYAAHMRQVIAQGSKTRRTMPGFSSTAGGPLNDVQIDSLVGYLKTLK